MGKIVKCDTCGEEIAKWARSCTKCGDLTKTAKQGVSYGCLFVILGPIVLFLMLIVLGMISSAVFN